MNAVFLTLLLVLPALLIYLGYRFSVFRKIGTVLLCYLTGMVLGNIGILPEGFGSLQNSLSEISVALALPLLLFSLDVRSWFKVAGKAMASMLFAVISIVIVSLALFLIFREVRPGAWQLAGMSLGVYTGGTPNLASIKAALDISSADYILFHTYDTIFSLIYIFLLVSVAQRFFLRYLNPFPRRAVREGSAPEEQGAVESLEEYRHMLKPRALADVGLALVLSAVIVGLSVLGGSLFPSSSSAAVTILLITTLGIGASFVGPIRRLRNSFQGGMYIIFIFCLTVASMTDFKGLARVDGIIMIFVVVGIFGSLMIHSLFCRWAGIDVDTFLVTSVSAICSPPFVPVVAGALKNPAVLLSGLTTGIVGYAVGNYLGISLAFLFKSLP